MNSKSIKKSLFWCVLSCISITQAMDRTLLEQPAIQEYIESLANEALVRKSVYVLPPEQEDAIPEIEQFDMAAYVEKFKNGIPEGGQDYLQNSAAGFFDEDFKKYRCFVIPGAQAEELTIQEFLQRTEVANRAEYLSDLIDDLNALKALDMAFSLKFDEWAAADYPSDFGDQFESDDDFDENDPIQTLHDTLTLVKPAVIQEILNRVNTEQMAL